MHFIKLQDLTINEIKELVKRSLEFKQNPNLIPNLKDNYVCNIFLEPSTRTHLSFKMAEHRMNMHYTDLQPFNSSFQKNETLEDTVLNLKAIGYNNFVIRSSENEWYNSLLEIKNVSLINAGDGTGNHPSQSLLDIVTIFEHFGYFESLKVLFIGDIKHSRVFKSNYEVMKKLKMSVSTFGPEEFTSNLYEKIDNLEQMKDFDIVVFLRVQHERHEEKFSTQEYNSKYGLNSNSLKYLKENAVYLHPGPVNRGVEIESNVLYSNKSKILSQVENGVFARIAILEYANKKI